MVEVAARTRRVHVREGKLAAVSPGHMHDGSSWCPSRYRECESSDGHGWQTDYPTQRFK